MFLLVFFRVGGVTKTGICAVFQMSVHLIFFTFSPFLKHIFFELIFESVQKSGDHQLISRLSPLFTRVCSTTSSHGGWEWDF